MATNDIASLGIQVTTTGVDQAKRSLDDLAKSGDGAAQSVEKVGESADQARARLHEMVQQSAQAGSGTAAITESQRSLAERLRETTAAMGAQSKATVDWAAEQAAANARGAAINAASDRAAAQTKAAAVGSLAEQREALAKLVGQIDPTVAALGRLDAQQAKLAAFRKSGVLGAEDFAAYNAAIEANRIKVTAASGAMHQFSLNNALARRELGRMAADMANGNWGRFQQTSLTLANASGLMSLAFSGVGVAVMAAAVAVGVFVIGATKGWAETEKLRVSLIATGDAAGTSAANLNSMAVAVGRATGHWGDARKAIEAFTASGKYADAGMSGLAVSVVDASEVTGLSIDKIVKQFESLQDKPAASVAKLNEQYHFLTAAQYAQIQSLEEEGRTRDAARLAESAYTNAMHERAQEVENNAGWIIKSAHAVRDAWNEAWASIKSVGAPLGMQDQINIKQEQVKQLSGGRFMPNGQWQAGASADDPRVKQLNAEIDDLRRQQVAAGFKVNDDQLKARANADSIAAQRATAQFDSPSVKRDNAIKLASKHMADQLGGEGLTDEDRERIRTRYANEVTAANEAFAAAMKKGDARTPAGGSRSAADPFASLTGLVQKAQVFDAGVGNDKAQNQQVASILAVVDAGAKLIASGKDVAKVQAMVATGVGALNDGYAKQAAIIEQENLIAVQKYQAALDKQNDALQRSIDAQVDQLGMGDKDYRRQQQLTEVYQKNADALAHLAVERAKIVADGKSTTAIDGEILAQQRNTDVQVRIAEDGFKRVDAAQASWQLGAIRAMENVRDEGANVAGMTANVFTNAFGNMGDAIANFVKTGKLDFKSLADSIITDIVRMEARMMASKFASGILSGILGGGTEMATSFDSNGTFFSPYAKGGAFDGSASLSAYSGQVVNKPTLFAFARGAGVMGEAGPEAIMPLTRGPDGKLGVQAAGSSAPQVEIHITNNGQPVQAQQTSQRTDGNRVIIDMVLDAVAGDMVRGGRTAKAMQQRFGLAQRGVPVGA